MQQEEPFTRYISARSFQQHTPLFVVEIVHNSVRTPVMVILAGVTVLALYYLHIDPGALAAGVHVFCFVSTPKIDHLDITLFSPLMG